MKFVCKFVIEHTITHSSLTRIHFMCLPQDHQPYDQSIQVLITLCVGGVSMYACVFVRGWFCVCVCVCV